MKIEINMEKKHFWALVGLIVILFTATVAIAKTTTVPWTDDRPFHDILYADIIAGKSDDRVIVDDDANVTGHLGVNGNVDVGGTIIGNGSGIYGVPVILVSPQLTSVAGSGTTGVSYSFTAAKTGTALIMAKAEVGGIAGASNTFYLNMGGTTLDSMYVYGDDYVAYPVLIGTQSVTSGTSYTVTLSGSRNANRFLDAKIIVII